MASGGITWARPLTTANCAACVSAAASESANQLRAGLWQEPQRNTRNRRAPRPSRGARRLRVLRWGSCHSPALSWFALSLAAALTQAAQFAVVKGRAQVIPPLAIVAGTQLVAFTTWFLYFVFTHETFTP